MRNSETGEFEIVVGNKQLLSTFFVIVLLCSAAFVMGYVLGENSRSSKTTAELGTTSPAVPVTGPSEARPQPASPAAPPPTAPPADGAGQQPPAQTATAQEPPAATHPAEAQPDQPTTQPARELQKEAEKNPPPAPVPTGLAAYWQVTATSNAASAQDLMQTLKEKGFPARLSPGRDNLIRVLVGPYSDKTSFAKAKLDIESGGFGTPVVAK